MLDFININFIDVLDVIIVAFIFFEVFKLTRGTNAISIFMAIMVLYIIWIIARVLGMELLTLILGQILGVGVLALIILFQQEIRRFLLHLGNATPLKKRRRRSIFYNKLEGFSPAALDEITNACSRMSTSKTGALIVIKHESSLEPYIETGDVIDAAIHRRLIENLFFKNSPLHDGAMIITHDRIVAVRCTLPITDSQNINPGYGMRHKAAIGITEQTDAEAIVVSEETGNISYVANGVITLMSSIIELRVALENSFK
ncbi:MAG: diadenylate cyclase CdaA [Bacteroidales bacterium]|nr:diadenylate cyclase CdaA [Bacteroidales bacterium]